MYVQSLFQIFKLIDYHLVSRKKHLHYIFGLILYNR